MTYIEHRNEWLDDHGYKESDVMFDERGEYVISETDTGESVEQRRVYLPEKPDYAIRYEIIDRNNGEVVLERGVTFLHTDKRVTHELGMELLEEESAETELWSVLRRFRYGSQPRYESENYPTKAEAAEQDSDSN